MNPQTFAEGFSAAQMVIAAHLRGITQENSLAQPSKEGRDKPVVSADYPTGR